MSICPKHGIERRQRFKDGSRAGFRCSECDREYNHARRGRLTPEQRAEEAEKSRIYRSTRLTDEQKKKYNRRKALKRLAMPKEERVLLSRRQWLRFTYGLTLEEYDLMVNAQAGACAICERVPEKLFVDHCHNSNKVRALLCNDCNLGLGHFGDSPKVLTAAIAYLKRF